MIWLLFTFALSFTAEVNAVKLKHKITLMRGDLAVMSAEGIKPNFSAIARKYNLDRHTVKSYWLDGKIKSHKGKQGSSLDQFKQEIQNKLAHCPYTTKKALFMYFRNKYGAEIFKSYSTFSHYMSRNGLKVKNKLSAHPRYETPPGQQLQVDWKESLKMRLKSGKIVEFNLFVATFGYSRYHYYLYSKGKTTMDFLRCLILCLRMAGGKPKTILTDNMPAIVSIKHGKKTKHELIKQFEKDCKIKINLCKARTPQTKGKVESANRFMRWLSPYNGELESEAELIKLIETLSNEINRQTNQSTGIPPLRLYKKETEHLDPLPNNVMLESYVENAITKQVPTTLLVHFQGSEYSVPAKFIGKMVKLIHVDNELYIYSNTELIAVHEIKNKKFNYHQEHYKEALAQRMPDGMVNEEIERRAQSNLAQLDQLEDM